MMFVCIRVQVLTVCMLGAGVIVAWLYSVIYRIHNTELDEIRLTQHHTNYAQQGLGSVAPISSFASSSRSIITKVENSTDQANGYTWSDKEIRGIEVKKSKNRPSFSESLKTLGKFL